MKFGGKFIFATITAAIFAACTKHYDHAGGSFEITIDPIVTRVTNLHFESDDRIGVTIIKSDEQQPYIDNAEFINDGSIFTAVGTTWYGGRQSADMRAYYPYDAAGEPVTFTVKADQRGSGYSQSDFMTAVKNGVTPTSTAVPMIFRHRLVKINIEIENHTSGNITETGIRSCAVTATVDVAAESALPCASSAKEDIIACESQSQNLYTAIIAPQTAALTFYVKTDDGAEPKSIGMSSAEFTSGKQYTARITVTEESLGVQMSGDIEDWGETMTLTPDGNGLGGLPEVPDDTGGDKGSKANVVNWGGENYPTVRLADGRTWMAANLRYAPDGKSPSADPGDGSGVWYPCNESKTAVTESAFVAEHGYLYSPQAAHGGAVATGEAAVQGICPDGWHLPVTAEFEALKAAYPDAAALQAAGFGLVAGGGINAVSKYIYLQNGEVYLWGSSVTDGGTYCFKITSAGDGWTYQSAYHAAFGASVRCIKDL